MSEYPKEIEGIVVNNAQEEEIAKEELARERIRKQIEKKKVDKSNSEFINKHNKENEVEQKSQNQKSEKKDLFEDVKELKKNKKFIIAFVLIFLALIGTVVESGNNKKTNSTFSACECRDKWLVMPRSSYGAKVKYHDICVREWGGFANANEECNKGN